MGCAQSKLAEAPVSPAVQDVAGNKTPVELSTSSPKDSAPTIAKDANIIFVLGGPGSGKGTQCEKILARYSGIRHLSAGDLLREAVKNGNKEMEAIMKEGKLVPMQTTISLLKEAMAASEETTFLIDGFPRALDQADAFEKQPEMRNRLLERGKTSGRADDNEETIVKRFRTFVEQSKPVIEHYKAKGKCALVSSSGSPDEVFLEVVAAIEKHLPKFAASALKPTAPALQPVVKASKGLPPGSKVIFVLGGPGSGKGTQCEKILEEYKDLGVMHFSTGDLLRDAVKKGNKELEAIMKEGKLVPLETTVGLLRDAMVTSGGKIFLVDGFPRAADQAAAFEASVQAPEAVLFFDCSEAVMRERLLSRGKTSGRADDNEDTIVKRFHTFVEQSKPVVEAYKARKLCVEVSAMRTPVEVFADVKAALDARLRGAGGKELPKGSKIVFVLGGPGSGKGTQCEKILAHYKDFVHLSAGDLLRDAVKKGNKDLEAIMKEGKLVPMETTIGLLKEGMLSSGGKLFLIDGFPRALDQAHAFEESIQPCDAVLFFDCSEEVMRRRLLERGKTSGRADDNEEAIVKRFRTFVEQSKPVVEEFKAAGKVYEISSEQTPDAVFNDVNHAMDKILA